MCTTTDQNKERLAKSPHVWLITTYLLYIIMCSFLCKIACHRAGQKLTHSPNKHHLLVARWLEVSSGGQFLFSGWSRYPQPGFDLPRCYWALLNCFRTNQGHCASCWKKWGLAATDVPLWQMPNDVKYFQQLPTVQAAVTALSWWRCYRMAEDIQHGS